MYIYFCFPSTTTSQARGETSRRALIRRHAPTEAGCATRTACLSSGVPTGIIGKVLLVTEYRVLRCDRASQEACSFRGLASTIMSDRSIPCQARPSPPLQDFGVWHRKKYFSASPLQESTFRYTTLNPNLRCYREMGEHSKQPRWREHRHY